MEFKLGSDFADGFDWQTPEEKFNKLMESQTSFEE